MAAVRAGDAEFVRRALAADPDALRERYPANDKTPNLTTLLHLAMPGDGVPRSPGQLEVARVILDAGLEVDTPAYGPNQGTCTALTLAAWGGQAPLVRLLVSRGADVDGRADTLGSPRPIATAASHGHGEAVEALIEAGARHSLLEVIQGGLRDRLERSLRADPSIANGVLPNGTFPLHAALSTRSGHPLVQTLLAHGANPARRDATGRTAAHAAIESEQFELACRLVSTVTATDDPFILAGLGDAHRLRQLLSANPESASERFDDGTTPLFYAVIAGSDACVHALLAGGADVSPASTRFWSCATPLHLAIKLRRRSLMKLLLKHGAELNADYGPADSYWPTPLHLAARWGTIEDLITLLDHGADYYGGRIVPGIRHIGVCGWIVFADQSDYLRILLDRGLNPRDPRVAEVLASAAPGSNVAALLRAADPESS